MEEILKVGDVAKILCVCSNTVRRLSDSGYLTVAFRIGKRGDRRYRRENIEQFMSDSLCGSGISERK